MHIAAINLDKLRNVVQKFSRHSFTTSQVARDYLQGEHPQTPESQAFEGLLQRHAALLGIRPAAPTTGLDTVWVAAI